MDTASCPGKGSFPFVLPCSFCHSRSTSQARFLGRMLLQGVLRSLRLLTQTCSNLLIGKGTIILPSTAKPIRQRMSHTFSAKVHAFRLKHIQRSPLHALTASIKTTGGMSPKTVQARTRGRSPKNSSKTVQAKNSVSFDSCQGRSSSKYGTSLRIALAMVASLIVDRPQAC